MVTCPNCGIHLEENSLSCPNCGFQFSPMNPTGYANNSDNYHNESNQFSINQSMQPRPPFGYGYNPNFQNRLYQPSIGNNNNSYFNQYPQQVPTYGHNSYSQQFPQVPQIVNISNTYSQPTKVNIEEDEDDDGGCAWVLLGFFIPIVGLILFIVWNSSRPNTAKSAGTGALCSFILSIIGYIIFAIVSASSFL